MLRLKYGLTITDHDLATTIVPSVARSDRKITMEDVTAANEEVCLNSVSTALNVYSPDLVRALVSNLVLADDIHIWNTRVGAFQAPGMIAVNCIQASSNLEADMASVHEVIAVKVLDMASPDWTKWTKYNPKDFRYGDLDDYKAQLGRENGRDVVEKLNRMGFVNQYGLTGKENDFESYAQQMFEHGAEFAAIVRMHPTMQSKLNLVIRSYMQVEPGLAQHFKTTGLDRFAALP